MKQTDSNLQYGHIIRIPPGQIIQGKESDTLSPTLRRLTSSTMFRSKSTLTPMKSSEQYEIKDED